MVWEWNPVHSSRSKARLLGSDAVPRHIGETSHSFTVRERQSPRLCFASLLAKNKKRYVSATAETALGPRAPQEPRMQIYSVTQSHASPRRSLHTFHLNSLLFRSPQSVGCSQFTHNNTEKQSLFLNVFLKYHTLFYVTWYQIPN